MKTRAAFTLIEMIMVIVILSFFAVVTVVDIGSYQAQHLRAAAERMAADVRNAKNLAQAAGKWQGVSFSIPANTYSVYETDGSVDTIAYTVNLATDYHGVSIYALDNLPGNKIEFDPRGAPYSDKNGSALAATATIVLRGAGTTPAGGCSCGGQTYFSVSIDPGTGRVYVQ